MTRQPHPIQHHGMIWRSVHSQRDIVNIRTKRPRACPGGLEPLNGCSTSRNNRDIACAAVPSRVLLNDTCWIIGTCAATLQGESIKGHATTFTTGLYGGALPYFTISGKSVLQGFHVREFIRSGSVSPLPTLSSRKRTQHERKRERRVKAVGGVSAPASLWVYGFSP